MPVPLLKTQEVSQGDPVTPEVMGKSCISGSRRLSRRCCAYAEPGMWQICVFWRCLCCVLFNGFSLSLSPRFCWLLTGTVWRRPPAPAEPTARSSPPSCGCRSHGRRPCGWCGSGRGSCRGCGAGWTGEEEFNLIPAVRTRSFIPFARMTPYHWREHACKHCLLKVN